MNEWAGPVLPRALTPGGTIGVAAPAGPFPRDRFEAGLSRLRSLGYETLCPPSIYEQDAYLAGSDASRAEVLTDLICRPDTQAVMAARGGYGVMRLLPLLDWRALAEHPKIIMGFSDITALLLPLWQHTGLVTFHGPVVTSLADADAPGILHLQGLLAGEPVFPVGLESVDVLHHGRAEGPLLGGNLTMLVHLLAAGWLPDMTGAILFLEDTGESPYRLDRMITTLRLAGVLDRVGGILCGYFTDCGAEAEIRDVLDRTLFDFNGPVVYGFPCGHGPQNLVLPVGPRAVLDTRRMTLDVVEPYLA